jgi:hypothetical protein
MNAVMESEIQSLDSQTRKNLTSDMMGELESGKSRGNEGPAAAAAAPLPEQSSPIKDLAATDAPANDQVRFKVPSFSPKIRDWKFEVQDDSGQVVKTITGISAPPKYLQWDRKDAAGRTIAGEGNYRYVLKTTDAGTPMSAVPTTMALKPEAPVAALAPEIESADPVRAFPENGRFFTAAEHIKLYSVPIMQQRENHILITVGDVVYFPTPGFKSIRPRECYRIFKIVGQDIFGSRGKAGAGYEQVGELRIVETHGQLSIGLIVAARDIITEGDAIFLATP